MTAADHHDHLLGNETCATEVLEWSEPPGSGEAERSKSMRGQLRKSFLLPSPRDCKTCTYLDGPPNG